ncbi:hypothetical protein CRE_15123 [Caenorhabditis remanei]|uniref:Serpentine Receptor, class I n=1 Tax=Caenorhabditis remanei TaxID=31234 RepID=E3NQI9_CAERE|nr:hypothetical protein CRE_15123 [Caenorhabditis remanei]
MSDNYLETDLKIPQFLIHHYYISGSICIAMNTFVIYLLVFRKGRLDTFRFYLLAFQLICFSCDFHLSFLMQLVPFFPYIVGGFAVGILPRHSILTPHYCMTILSFLVGFQINTLTICFLRKHRAITRMSGKYAISKKVYNCIAISCLLIPFSYSIPFHLTGKTKEEQFQIIDIKYPLFRSKFEKLSNFEIYEFDIMMKTFSAMVSFGCVHSVSTVSVLVFQMYHALILCSLSLSKATLEKHKSSLKSLIGQVCRFFLTTPIAILPSVMIVLTIVVPFEGAQVFTWYLLMIMTTHSTINCLVVIFTFPEFRAFVLFWSKEGRRWRQSRLVSRSTSLVGTRTVRNTFVL